MRRSARDSAATGNTFRLDPGISDPVQPLPPCYIKITLRKEWKRLRRRERFGNDELCDGIISNDAGYEGVARRMFTHPPPRGSWSLDDDGITLIEPPVPGIDRGTDVVKVAIDFRKRVEGWWGAWGVWVMFEV